MRSFGRQCRGKGKVFVTLVRQTETQLLDLGESLATWSQEAKNLLDQAPQLSEVQRGRLRRDLEAALERLWTLAAPDSLRGRAPQVGTARTPSSARLRAVMSSTMPSRYVEDPSTTSRTLTSTQIGVPSARRHCNS